MTLDELTEAGVELSKLLQEGAFERIASEYGYAISFDKSPIVAVEDDFNKACEEAVGDIYRSDFTVRSCYFKEPEMGLVALVTCTFPLERQTGVIAELILNSEGVLYLEQISSYRGQLNA